MILFAKFSSPEWLKGDLVMTIRRERPNEALGRDGVHNEKLKV